MVLNRITSRRVWCLQCEIDTYINTLNNLYKNTPKGKVYDLAVSDERPSMELVGLGRLLGGSMTISGAFIKHSVSSSSMWNLTWSFLSP